MLNIAYSNCVGFVITPFIEAFRKRGVFDLIDTCDIGDIASLAKRAKANPCFLALALESMKSPRGQGIERARAQVNVDLTPLYACSPERLLIDEAAIARLHNAINVAFFERGNSVGVQAARGAVLVLLARALRNVEAESFTESLRCTFPDALSCILALLEREKYLDLSADALTSAGRKWLKDTGFLPVSDVQVALLARAEELLFGDCSQVLREGRHRFRQGDVSIEESGQWTVESTPVAEMLVVLAAAIGVFNERHPQHQQMTAREYSVRYACEEDLNRLCELESLCWQHTRASREQLRGRILRLPQGQFVVEKDGRVLGVVYSQRISSEELLIGCTADEVHRLHDADGPVVQLLALNVDPSEQDHGYGDQLLEFMLQRCALVDCVKRVVGVTLCKAYERAAAESFDEYVSREGATQDPVLAFHWLHGAKIVRSIPGYRPEDSVNERNGVLVAYDIRRRPERQSLIDGLRSQPSAVTTREIQASVLAAVASLSGIDAARLDRSRPLMEMGLDSAHLLHLQRRLEELFGVQLEAGFFFVYGTLTKVIGQIRERLDRRSHSPNLELIDDRKSPVAETQEYLRDDAPLPGGGVAIVGMACQLPGGIESPEQLWAALAAGVSSISSFPASRGIWKTGIDRGGFVSDVELFDAAFFRMSPVEAQITDPQQRMLLQSAWACIEDAGVSAEQLKGTRTGVFIGASNCDYSRLLQDSGAEIQAHQGVGSSLAVLANRISYFFDLSGPSLLLDTACSSSLVALHSAVRSLRSGECDCAFVGGVNLICHPDLSIAYQKAGMLSPDGLCKTFDAAADGYVRSEGAVMILLKPVPAAIADGNLIHAIIRGSAINHGGLASGITVPNPQKQAELLVAAWQDACVAPHQLSYLEAHGTGTPLGDPIEIEGMQTAYAALSVAPAHATCAIGSVKSNLGHLESAAGLAGLLKVVLSMQRRQLPATVHFEKLNPKIKLEGSPFRIQSTHDSWSADAPRIAGVSSFGSGGTNAHVVLQEYRTPVSSKVAARARLFVLSAATSERLQAYARRCADWLKHDAHTVHFADAIYSWQIGRSAMKHRLAIEARDGDELLTKLHEWLIAREDLSTRGIWAGASDDAQFGLSHVWQTDAGKQLVGSALKEQAVDQLGPLWVSGVAMDWRELYSDSSPRRVSLPTYPFARERHWVDGPETRGAGCAARAGATLHPLLHVNTSTFEQQAFVSIFHGDEFFLNDHRVEEGGVTRRILPAAAYLEMAREAVRQALPVNIGTTRWQLRDVAWLQPVFVDEAVCVQIALSMNDGEPIEYAISSGADTVHCRGYVFEVNEAPGKELDIEQLANRQTWKELDPNRAYEAFTGIGMHYGAAHQVLTWLGLGHREALAKLQLPAPLKDSLGSYELHPSLLDGALQTALALTGLQENKLRLPFALESVHVSARCTEQMWVWVRAAAEDATNITSAKFDVDLCDARGKICVQLRGLSFRAAGAFAAQSIDVIVAQPAWETVACSSGAGDSEVRRVIVLCSIAVGSELAASTDAEVVDVALLEGALHERYEAAVLRCLEHLQNLLRSHPDSRVLYQLVVGEDETSAVFSGLLGLLKTAALENPQVQGQLIWVPAQTPAEELAYLLKEEADSPETTIRRGKEGRQVLRWREASERYTLPSYRDDGVYLITGGLGGLGLLFAREILSRTTQTKVVLCGRSNVDVPDLYSNRLEYQAADIGDRAQVEALLRDVRGRYGRLDGILHAAGVVADNFVVKKQTQEICNVLRAKVAGTSHLDAASAGDELDFFVLFGSVVGVLGNVGQGDYAAANGFLDGFAACRNARVAKGERRGRTVSIDWPLWAEGGMRIDEASQAWLARTFGLRALDTAAGMDAFHRCLALTSAQAVVLSGNLPQLRRTLSEVSVREVATTKALHVDASALSGQVERYLCEALASVLKLPTSTIDARARLESYGIDSILAMKLTQRLEEGFGPLPKTLFFEYQTIRELAGYFVEQHASSLQRLLMTGAHPRPLPVSSSMETSTPLVHRRSRRRQPAPAMTNEPIAIIGLSGRYPEAEDIAAYWRNLRDGKDCIVEVPKARWDWQAYYSADRNERGRHYSKWGGFISGVDEFDPLFFNISPREARFIDPQERLFLQHAWMALEDAGYTRESLQRVDAQDLPGQVGVYAGVMYSEYQLLNQQVDPQEFRMGFAGCPASIANRVSYVLNIHGPSLTVDTMCSSSLTAIHLASEDLKSGRTQLALAGGVNVSVHPNKYLVLSAGQFISSEGHCQSFGEGGDGYIPGEGVGVVVLKRLSDAERDGDQIYGVIRGSALNHGGRTNGYTVPNVQAQASVIARALREAGIDARRVGYVEAHGTGTKLGDPIEIAALTKAFEASTKEKGYCLLGSAKSNIGHCESAAGIAGLTKVLLQLKHRQIVPSLHSAQLNPHIDFAQTPFEVNQSLREWPEPEVEGRKYARMAGISSFGAGGSNAHLLVEEYEGSGRVVRHERVVVVLSARTPEQLKHKAEDLLKYVRDEAEGLDLTALGYTLQVGREAMEERVALVVGSAEQLQAMLGGWVEGQTLAGTWRGQVRQDRQALELLGSEGQREQLMGRWQEAGELEKLAEAWCKGAEVRWEASYATGQPRRISLPTYPFARERYWVELPPAKAATAVLHPLLHSNTSDLTEQRYSTHFSGEEFFLTDHRVRLGGGLRKVLPGVAYLEMACAAMLQAQPEETAQTVVELRDVVLAQPLIVGSEGADVHIALMPMGPGGIDYEIYSGEDETVHCQGSAVMGERSAPPSLSLSDLRSEMTRGRLESAALYMRCAALGLEYGPSLQGVSGMLLGDGELLAELHMPATTSLDVAKYELPPALLDSALQAAVGLMDADDDTLYLPYALEHLRIYASCTGKMWAWIRRAKGSEQKEKLDIDLCDEQGKVCVQMQGLVLRSSAQQKEGVIEAKVGEERPIEIAVAQGIARGEEEGQQRGEQRSTEPRRIHFGTGQAQRMDSTVRAKPSGLVLRAPSVLQPPAKAQRAPIVLVRSAVSASGAAPVELYEHGAGGYTLRIATADGSNELSEAVIDALLTALAYLRERSAKWLLLEGTARCFLRGGRAVCDRAIARGLYAALANLPCVVIGVAQGDALGAGWLLASLCDLLILSKEAQYGYASEETGCYPTSAEAAVLAARYGDALTQDLLFVSSKTSGKQLREHGWTCLIMPASEVSTRAQDVTVALQKPSTQALHLLKLHLNETLRSAVQKLAPAATVAAELECETVSSSKHWQAHSPAVGVLHLRGRVAGRIVSPQNLLEELQAQLKKAVGYKAIVLSSDSAQFLPWSSVDEKTLLELQQKMAWVPSLIVAAFEESAHGSAWLLGQCAQTCVYNAEGLYSAGDLRSDLSTAVCMQRWGAGAARSLLLDGGMQTGVALAQAICGLHVVEGSQVVDEAIALAVRMSHLPPETRAAWKARSAFSPDAEPQHRLEDEEVTPSVALETTTLPLESTVVSATRYADGVVLVKMEDRQARNMFSEALMAGVTEAFARIESTPGCKVVVLTGYDSYFSSGGSKDGLLAIQRGEARFTDYRIFESALRCSLPVIAAMQGHGLGAGWTLGMFADASVLSEESSYVSPYMSYGFTPGAGATWVLADRLGTDVARESLLTAQPMSGEMLRARNLRVQVLPRSEVLPAALKMAQTMAQQSRAMLRARKHQLAADVRRTVEAVYAAELAMHAQTFVGDASTLSRIEETFGATAETRAAPAPAPKQPVSVQRMQTGSIATTLRTLLAQELHVAEQEIGDEVQFIDLGLDSISGVSWIRKINEHYGIAIEATKIYSHPTLAQLSSLVEELRPSTPPPPADPALVVEEQPTASTFAKLKSRRDKAGTRLAATSSAAMLQPIAVIGMAGQFPQARDLRMFWRNLAEGKNCISEVPAERWDVEACYRAGESIAGKTNGKWMGALEDYDRFDPQFFNISPREAESMDPQQRLFMQACWQCIEDAGYDARVLSASKCGVFVGCAFGDYHLLSREQQLSAHGFTGDATSILAARISYFLNLQGPCVSIDTACSSSLVALAQACDSLSSGVSDTALAGGVYVMVGPEMHIKTAQAGMLSSQGRCFTFDQRADGFVPGEGVGVVMLKRLADAERDGDIIQGVIRGWGVNQDGKTNGITAPNPESQARLEREVYERFGIDPRQIQLIEAHGTGTKLGDPIEVEALKKAFAAYTQDQSYCALGSVKSNIGHCLTAAGAAGLIKLLLALKHRSLPPTIHFEQLNEHIDLTGSPFYVNDRLRPWTPAVGHRRQAALSSFGFSGTNAHIVVAEYEAPAVTQPRVPSQDGKLIIPLSARTKEQLQHRVRDLLEFLREKPLTDIAQLAYTLQVGREPMLERLGFMAASIDELMPALQAHLDGGTSGPYTYRTPVHDTEGMTILNEDDELHAAVIQQCVRGSKLSRLLEMWVRGLDVDWRQIYGTIKPGRIALPGYPFARERYWMEVAATSTADIQHGSTMLHPLLHRNTSDLNGQRYTSTFDGNELFLRDHQVSLDGATRRKVMPGVAHLELARAAVANSLPGGPSPLAMELRHVIWAQPLIVDEAIDVQIALEVEDAERIGYEIYSASNVYSQGHVRVDGISIPDRLDIAALRQRIDQRRVDADALYREFVSMGLHYGAAYQTVSHLWIGVDEVLAELELPSVAQADAASFGLHPSVLDGALQASVALFCDLAATPDKPLLPFAVDTVRVLTSSTEKMWAWLRYSNGARATGKIMKMDMDLCKPDGTVCVQIRGFTARSVEVGKIPGVKWDSFDKSYYEKLIERVAEKQISVDDVLDLE